jgi:hypothetical protein
MLARCNRRTAIDSHLCPPVDANVRGHEEQAIARMRAGHVHPRLINHAKYWSGSNASGSGEILAAKAAAAA